MKHLFGVINVETIWRQHVPRSQISSEFCSNLFGQGRSLGCRGVKVEAVPWLKQLSIPQTCVQRCPWGYGGGHQASTSCHCHTLSSHTHLPRGQAPPLAGSAASSICQLSHLPFQDTPHHRFRADRAQAPSSKSSGICVTRADGIFSRFKGKYRSTVGAKLPLHWHLRYSKAKVVVAKVLGILDRETPVFFRMPQARTPQKSLQSRCSASAGPPSIQSICTSVWAWKSASQLSKPLLRPISSWQSSSSNTSLGNYHVLTNSATCWE